MSEIKWAVRGAVRRASQETIGKDAEKMDLWEDVFIEALDSAGYEISRKITKLPLALVSS